ncbi:penicillin-binding protein [Virgibacillus sp. NKC19-3]|uniref:transglycosylase domain-containing protein n=1 Tax=Virgibacillus saliphilus TaxID=2831674 RepID=UPI001C9B2B65|nr:transglycosylase domain-containing protein [Virgibacillus sp. NKC19-3]MBY7143890.1 penicillin-binding protein [Virgibacillus sp. NKC19-3]
MDVKQLYHKYKKKIKKAWITGDIQRSSRVTYDVTWNVILFFLIIGFIGLFFAGGIGAGYFASLVKDEPVLSYESMEQDIYNYEETSELYFADEQSLGDIRSDLHREEVDLENISETLIHAVIATEDEYFNEHEGVVPKAILRAVVQEATNADNQSGGSTLTQQLIKNQVLTDEVSFERKAKEILLALRLERFFDKGEILEAYLNIVPYGRDASGRNIAGIQTAAKGIFNLNADEVNLPQAAYLAGLPQSPSSYTPFSNQGDLKDEDDLKAGLNRMKSVLQRMYDEGYITNSEYEEALDYDIVGDFADKFQSPIEQYPSLTFELQDRATDIIMKHIANEDGYTSEDLNNDADLRKEYEELAERDLRRSGYQIHSTIDKDIFDTMQEITEKFDNFGPDTVTTVELENGEETEITQQVQASGILIENSSGKIISFVGGREYNEDNQLNYATNAVRSNGSTIKPLLVYAPAMEKGIIQPGSPIADVDLPIGPQEWEPSNYSGAHYGIIPARKALSNSYNVSTARIYSQMIEDDPGEYIKKMGITTIADEEFENPSLSIGGTTTGVTLEENTNAFATFGNNGQFADAYMIDKITTKDGETIYEHENETEDVFSPETNYLTIDILRDVMDDGTGTHVNSQLANTSVDWAGKTGTSQDWENAWFVATNPNVTFGTWMGYDIPDSLYRSSDPQGYSYRVQQFWAELINGAAERNPDLINPSSSFEQPDGVVEQSYCLISGMLPSDLCEEVGLVQTDLFNKKFVPEETDDSLIRAGSNVTVNENDSDTSSEFVEGNGITFNPEFLEQNNYDRLNDITELYPRTNRERWEKIGFPTGENLIEEDQIEDENDNNDDDGNNDDDDNDEDDEDDE